MVLSESIFIRVISNFSHSLNLLSNKIILWLRNPFSPHCCVQILLSFALQLQGQIQSISRFGFAAGLQKFLHTPTMVLFVPNLEASTSEKEDGTRAPAFVVDIPMIFHSTTADDFPPKIEYANTIKINILVVQSLYIFKYSHLNSRGERLYKLCSCTFFNIFLTKMF